MYNIENRVGRLLEIRIATPVDEGEAAELRGRHQRVLAGIDGQYVSAIDLRHAHVFPSPVTEVFIHIMSATSPRLQRSALLIGPSATFGLQAERAIKEGGNPARRAFRDPGDLEAWLGEVLTPLEKGRLRLFLTAAAAAP